MAGWGREGSRFTESLARGRWRTPRHEEATPESFLLERSWWVKRREIPWGSAVSRETSHAHWEEYLEVEPFRPFASDWVTTGRESRWRPVHHSEWENPGGRKAQESCAPGFSLNRWIRWRTFARRNTLKVGMLVESGPNTQRGKAPETAYGCAGGRKLWRATPRADPAWNRAGRLGADEGARRLRKPGGAGGRVWQARPNNAAAPSGKALKGSEPQGRRRVWMLGSNHASETLGNQGSKRRLGAWATSEEEPKPMRGSRWTYLVFPGTWYVKTLKSSRKAKDKRGAPEPVGALALSGLKLCRVR